MSYAHKYKRDNGSQSQQTVPVVIRLIDTPGNYGN